MPELLLELLSEEIPAALQAPAARDLARLVGEVLAPLEFRAASGFYGARRIALVAEVAAVLPGRRSSERGPRTGAPRAALEGFLRKHGAAPTDVVEQNGYWVLERRLPPVAAETLLAQALPGVLRRFPWPKSMRWGASNFTWIRPLRRILCLFGGKLVPFSLAAADDAAYGLASGALTEGHRFHAPEAFLVHSAAEWEAELRRRFVLVRATERRERIEGALAAFAGPRGLAFGAGRSDRALLDEVTGLAEWPVVLAGRIDERYMDLPPEVMRVTMRTNQRYFTFQDEDGRLARDFCFVANIEAKDGGRAIIAGNERVLAARLADARYFWDLDRRTPLEALLPKLEHMTFHAKLGSQAARVERLVALVGAIARAVPAPVPLAERAARLAKADLVSGMVGEFPELQGVMGGYYASHDGEDAAVARAIREHYAPEGPTGTIPAEPVSIALALADKLDTLAAFFAIGEEPTGSRDPYGLRRAALGVIRIIRENGLRIHLVPLLEGWCARFVREAENGSRERIAAATLAALPARVLAFLAERLRVQLRAEGRRQDVLTAVFAAHPDDDLTRLLARADALAEVLATDVGPDLLTAYRRAANILRIEERKDGPFAEPPCAALFREPEERALARALDLASRGASGMLETEHFERALEVLSPLRAPLDAFFARVTVNAKEPELRRNRLRLLNDVRETLNRIADLSKIETREEPAEA